MKETPIRWQWMNKRTSRTRFFKGDSGSTGIEITYDHKNRRMYVAGNVDNCKDIQGEIISLHDFCMTLGITKKDIMEVL